MFPYPHMRYRSEDRAAPGYTRIRDFMDQERGPQQARKKRDMDKDEPLWSRIACRVLMNVVTHPFDYVKVLIQIGYEPIDPRPTTTLLGRPALGLPNIFQYVRYIKSVDGFYGCYRGLAPKLCAHTICAVAFDKSVKAVKFEDEPIDTIPIDDLDDMERDKRYVQEFFKNLIGRTVGVILSHPFDVISVRMMAQFVGGEIKYITIVGSIREIYRENGLSGFFSGIIPRLIAHATTLALVSSSTYIINKYFIQDRELRTYTSATMTFLASTITYPFLVVSQSMAVNNCGLTAGEPPMMPIYVDWVDCWRHLSRTKQLMRGSSLLWRYYTGPQIIINGRAVVDKTSLYMKKIE